MGVARVWVGVARRVRVVSGGAWLKRGGTQ